MTDFSKTLIRCSTIYNIMGAPEAKTPYQKYLDAKADIEMQELNYKVKYIDENKEHLIPAQKQKVKIRELKEELLILEAEKDFEILSTGCKTHLSSLYAWTKYHKWSANKDKGNKYTAKGKLAENDSIKLLSETDFIAYNKNEERVDNEYLTGIPDILLSEDGESISKVIDIKTPWDAETFFSNLGKPLNTQYWWQIQGYMALTGAILGEVVFCLVNTPESIINKEKYRIATELDIVTEENPEYKRKIAELINNLTFDDIPTSDRIIRFKVERDENAIQKVYRKVEKCREYLIEIEKLHLGALETENILI